MSVCMDWFMYTYMHVWCMPKWNRKEKVNKHVYMLKFPDDNKQWTTNMTGSS